jgi:DNA-binding MarR family transcriptional regulator
MLLLCFSAAAEKRGLCVKQLRSFIGESGTSVLRRIEELEAAGLLMRARDAIDARRTIVRLTEDGLDRMKRFFRQIDEQSESFGVGAKPAEFGNVQQRFTDGLR